MSEEFSEADGEDRRKTPYNSSFAELVRTHLSYELHRCATSGETSIDASRLYASVKERMKVRDHDFARAIQDLIDQRYLKAEFQNDVWYLKLTQAGEAALMSSAGRVGTKEQYSAIEGIHQRVEETLDIVMARSSGRKV